VVDDGDPARALPFAAVGTPCERAEAIIGGVIAEAEVRTNRSSGREFRWARVEVGGTNYEIVAEPLNDALFLGNAIEARCWLVARRAPTTG